LLVQETLQSIRQAVGLAVTNERTAEIACFEVAATGRLKFRRTAARLPAGHFPHNLPVVQGLIVFDR
jgi:hypothetical protein